MRVEKIKISATIPVQQYGNISPEIEISDIENKDEALALGLKTVKELFSKYSERGPIKESDIDVGVVEEKISFNEGVKILYNDGLHTYTFNGKELISATQLIKKFYKDFDEESISKASAKSWGVEQEELRTLWKNNGSLTSDFGSVAHKALELYEKYKSMGAKIQETKDLPENYALPKHPILKDIVSGFEKINKTVGEYVVAEALITDIASGYCGHADRVLVINAKKKICRIQDYKFNIGSEEIKKDMKPLSPFELLPANKISKYQLQLSVYANMLEKSGWTVEGLDVFVYEDEWKHFPLEVLKVI